MDKIKKLAIGASATAILFGSLAGGAFAKNENKVDVCHREGNGSYHLINVSTKALPAHQAHGDGLPGIGFDENCVVEEWQLIDTITVNSNSTTGSDSTAVLTDGEEYRIVAKGEWTNRGFESVDADWTSPDNWTTQLSGPGAPGVWDERLLDLQINETFLDWGSYVSTHEYEYLFTPGTTGIVNFRVFDGDVNTNIIDPGWYGDNVGNLTVEIYSH